MFALHHQQILSVKLFRGENKTGTQIVASIIAWGGKGGNIQKKEMRKERNYVLTMASYVCEHHQKQTRKEDTPGTWVGPGGRD